MKLNELERQKPERPTSWQWVRHNKLYSDLIQVKEGTFGHSAFSAAGTLVYASEVLKSRGLNGSGTDRANWNKNKNCSRRNKKNKNADNNYQNTGVFLFHVIHSPPSSPGYLFFFAPFFLCLSIYLLLSLQQDLKKTIFVEIVCI